MDSRIEASSSEVCLATVSCWLFFFENSTKELIACEISRKLLVPKMYLFLQVKQFLFCYDGIKFSEI